ncbi:MAG: TonB family protein [Candidatus Omnitrophota bacterium]|nr:MAG: TonB family protein [Candidatus Omnitrophota bacterium]
MKYSNKKEGTIKRVFLTIGIFAFLLAGNCVIYSQSFSLFDDLEEEVTLVVGEVYVIPVTSLQRVSVRNPDIADISKVTDEEVVIVAKQAGDTAVTLWEKTGKSVIELTIYPHDLEKIKKKVERVIKRLGIQNVKFKINEPAAKVMIIGEVLLEEKEQVDTVLEPFADKVDNLLTVEKESKMVEIEARILELSKTELDELGIDWQDHLTVSEGIVTDAIDAEGNVQTFDVKVGVPWRDLWEMDVGSRTGLNAKINMLISDGKGKELSRPKLLCLSGEEAKLTVGGEVPYVSATTAAAAGTTISIEYREYGVILTIRPTVVSDDRVYLSLKSEVSALDWENAIIVSGIEIPAFITREAETVLNLFSGETIFIAGLIQNSDSTNVTKLPALGDIPILGALFRSKSFQNDETELVISLTPRAVGVEPPKQEAPAEVKESKRRPSYAGFVPEELQGYILDVQKQILNNLAYPRDLFHTGWEGVVVLKLTIDHTGELKSVRIVKSSGYTIFDESAVHLVQDLSFSPFPPDVQLEEVRIDVPINYRESN